MTDTVTLFVSVEHITVDAASKATLPFEISRIVNHHGEVLTSKPVPKYLKSPLTKATYLVTPVFSEEYAQPENLVGYSVSINVPACVVGNNALLQMLVYWCCVFALNFLKCYLLDQECSVKVVDQLDLEHSEIRFVALTYLIDCKDQKEANAFNRAIADYGDATLNTRHTNAKQKKPVTVWSSAGQSTVTITKFRHFEAKSYVKVGPLPKSFEDFASKQISDAIYAESGRKVRVELNANFQWLNGQGLTSPLAWKNKAKAATAYQLGLKKIRDYLRVSESLRSKRPKPEHMSVLAPAEQTILLDYLSGNDPKKHAQIVGKKPQYFSRVKRNIEKALRIDITIPWAVHSKKISPHLPSWLQWFGDYKPPVNLVDHCFVRETAKVKLKELRKLLAMKRALVPKMQLPVVSISVP